MRGDESHTPAILSPKGVVESLRERILDINLTSTAYSCVILIHRFTFLRLSFLICKLEKVTGPISSGSYEDSTCRLLKCLAQCLKRRRPSVKVSQDYRQPAGKLQYSREVGSGLYWGCSLPCLPGAGGPSQHCSSFVGKPMGQGGSGSWRGRKMHQLGTDP